MSLSKILGTIVGAFLGITIVSMFISATLEHTSAPALDVIAIILLGAFLGGGLGAFIGADDRRRRPTLHRPDQPLNREEIASVREWLRAEHREVPAADGPRAGMPQ